MNTAHADTAAPLLTAEDVVVEYGHGRHRRKVLHEVSLSLQPGECLGLVGESGSGKSTLGNAVLGLVPVADGRIRFDGTDITHLRGARRRALASDIQVVFQDPYGSLDPRKPIGQIVAEPLSAAGASRSDAAKAVREMLDRVRLPKDAAKRYPNEFSGGQRQRVAIARALINRPRLVVCDEPVSALDLTTQSAILDLFIELQRETGVAYLFVSHDLGVVRRVCHRVMVMYRGGIVETGPAPAVTSDPQDLYTKRLLMASPVADPARQAVRREAWLGLRATA